MLCAYVKNFLVEQQVNPLLITRWMLFVLFFQSEHKEINIDGTVSRKAVPILRDGNFFYSPLLRFSSSISLAVYSCSS